MATLRFDEAPELKWTAPFTLKPVDRPQIAAAKQNLLLEQAGRLKQLVTASRPEEKVQVRLCFDAGYRYLPGIEGKNDQSAG